MRRQDRPGARARLRRRGVPIAAYVGPNGSGKSWAMVYDTLPSLDEGRPVLSTVRLLDFRDPRPCPGGALCDDPAGHYVSRSKIDLVQLVAGERPQPVRTEVLSPEIHAAAHPFYVPLRTFEQLASARDADVLLDEVTGVASSRESSSLPAPVANLLVQLRRRGITLRWTAPAWGRSDKIIREVSQVVHLVSGHMPVERKTGDGEPRRLWRDRRLIWVKSYDAALMDDFDAHRTVSDSEIRPEIRAFYWRPGSLTDSAYSTDDAVAALGWAQEGGTCLSCGGRRSLKKCGCDHDSGGPSGAGVPAQAQRAGVRSKNRRGGGAVVLPLDSDSH